MYPAAYAYVSLQSLVNGAKSLGKKAVVRHAEPYAGQPVLLMALFEKGSLRQDIVALLQAAKNKGVYVICVNTLKIPSVNNYLHLIDCYIEKFNFGRDFGSYKVGFEYVYESGIAQECPRLLMLNDSVFYSEKNNASFLDEMYGSHIEALGGTENFEIEHHLGSFCIAFCGSILRNARFEKYWKGYRNTDVRPLVIKRGEMELSKVLKRCVSSPENFQALYDVTRASVFIKNNPAVLDGIATLARENSNPDLPSFTLGGVSKKVAAKFLHDSASLLKLDSYGVEIDDVTQFNVRYAPTVHSYTTFIHSSLEGECEVDELKKVVSHEVVCAFLEFFKKGSQIHQNAIFLHHAGIPLIKMDGLYRGFFSTADVESIASSLSAAQSEGFRRLIYARPYGKDTLLGWKRAAFFRGLI